MGSAGADNLFELDTKGICLLCLRNCTSSSSSSKNTAVTSFSCDSSSSAKSPYTSGERDCAFQSFKMLMRYLNIDVLQQCNFPPSFLQSVDGLQRDVKMVVKMCSDCLEKCQEFRQIYKQFEMLRLQLDECVQGLHHLMQHGDKNDDRVREYESLMKEGTGWNPLRLFHASIADNLRKETMRKCSLKVDKLIPRVMTSRPVSNEAPDYYSVSSPICVITATKGDLENDEEFTGPMSMLKVETSYFGDGADLNVNSNQQYKDEDHYINDKDNEDIEDPLANDSSSTPEIWATTTTTTASHDPSSTSSLFPTTSTDCIHCGKRCSNKSNLKTHLSYVHTFQTYSDQLPDGTSEDRLKTAIKYCIDQHRKIPSKDPKGQPRVQCGFCTKNYKDKCNVKIHILDVHFDEVLAALSTPSTITTKAERIITPSSSKTKTVAVKRTGVGVKHLTRRGRGRRKPEYTGPLYKCPICRKDFTIKAAMKNHFKIFHTQEGSNNMFRCDWCDKTFTNVFNKRCHVNSVHLYESSKDKLPPGTSELQLRTAIKIISKEQTSEKEPGKNKVSKTRCNYCGKMSCQNFFFRIHLVEQHFQEVIDRLDDIKDTLEAEVINNEDSSSGHMILQDDQDIMMEVEEEEQEMPMENFKHSNILQYDSMIDDDNSIANDGVHHSEQDCVKNPSKAPFQNDLQKQQHKIRTDSQSSTRKSLSTGKHNNGHNVDEEGNYDMPPILDLYDTLD